MSRPARRVVSLCPSITETVFALDRGDRLVGRTRYCVEPAGRVESVPDVGGTKSVKLDRLVSLAPDLVLANREENRREDVEALRGEGIPVEVFFPRDVPGTAAYIRELGDLLDASAAAAAMAAELEAMATPGEPDAEAPRVAYLIWRRPWMAAAAGTFIDALLRAGGLANALAGADSPYPAITAEELAAADPAAVLLSSEPFPFAEQHRAELVEATGLPAERFRFVDGQLLSWHGVRTLDGLRYARGLGQALRADPPG